MSYFSKLKHYKKHYKAWQQKVLKEEENTILLKNHLGSTGFSQKQHMFCLLGSWNHGTDWVSLSEMASLMAEKSLEGPTDRCTWTFGRAQTTSPDLLGSPFGEPKRRFPQREVERLRVKPNSWMIESTKSMVGNLWLENFQIPKILIVWVKWQLTH